MKKALVRVLVCGLFPLALLLPARGLDTNGRAYPPFSARVKLVVEADEGLEPKVCAHLARELRALDGVSVLGTGEQWLGRSDWLVSVVADEHTRGSEGTVGLTLSFVVLEVWRATTIAGMTLRMELLPQIMSEPGIMSPKADAVLEVARMGCLRQHTVWHGKRSDLDGLCKRAVSAFNTGPLAEARTVHQNIRKRAATP